MSDVTVRLQALDGQWQTCGVESARGVWPENVSLEADEWGPKTATFDLRRDPAAIWPDISAFTPVKVEVDGVLQWGGRVAETPSRDGDDRVMSVRADGWQAHLDDDLIRRIWVTDNLADWTDIRAQLTTDLLVFPSQPQVQTGAAAVFIRPSGIAVPQGTSVGVTWPVDSQMPGLVVVHIESSNFPAGQYRLQVRAHNAGGGGGVYGSLSSRPVIDVDAATTGLVGGYVARPTVGDVVWLSIVCHRSGAGTQIPTSDLTLKLRAARVFGRSSWQSAGVSTLKASDVVSTVVGDHCPLLHIDTPQVQATGFSIPSLVQDGPKTPRELISAVNAYHVWIARVNERAAVEFRPQPSTSTLTVGDWSAVEIQDAAANSGEQLYNRVIVTGTSPANEPVTLTRSTRSAPGMTGVDGGWTATNPTGTGGGPTVDTTFTGPTIRPGTPLILAITFTVAVTTLVGVQPAIAGSMWLPIFSQTFPAGTHTWSLDLSVPSETAPSDLSLDLMDMDSWSNITLRRAESGLIARRGFTRTKHLQVQSPLPADLVAAGQIADAFLASVSTTPFKGSVKVSGQGALRERLTGQPVAPADLLRRTGELLHFSDRVDPDTGACGRNGRITAVTYTPATDESMLTLDSSRTEFDALLTRHAAVTGS